MISFNSTNISKQSHTGFLIKGHVTVQATSEAPGYYIQYLRRLLRSGTLEGIQLWLIEMKPLETYLQYMETSSDRRCGTR